MEKSGDRKFDWVAALAMLSGAGVMVPSMIVLAISLLTVLMMLI